ncbi:MAG: zinc-binding alcohol dehydrogenase family protein [Phycisphaerae bacterium]|nr:zinc-binding alcohol dehydrogenase family protein [Phycisphaerae bacterium]
MKAVLAREPFDVSVVDVPGPEVRPGWVLLNVRAVGICGTDLYAYRGLHPFLTYPRILGHELAGEIADIDAEDAAKSGLSVGDHVAVEPYLNCGQCHMCRAGRSNACLKLEVLGVHCEGGMCERLVVPVEKAHKPTRPLSDDLLALVEPIGIGAQAVRRARVASGESVAVIGAGPIGVSAMLMARLAGARVAIVDLEATRLARAAEMGAELTIRPQERDVAEALLAFGEGLGPDAIIEAVGMPATICQAIECVRAGGRVAIVGQSNKPLDFSYGPMMKKELDVVASRNSAGLFPGILAAMVEGRLPAEKMITHRVGMAEVPGTLADMDARPSEYCKAVVRI